MKIKSRLLTLLTFAALGFSGVFASCGGEEKSAPDAAEDAAEEAGDAAADAAGDAADAMGE